MKNKIHVPLLIMTVVMLASCDSDTPQGPKQAELFSVVLDGVSLQKKGSQEPIAVTGLPVMGATVFRD